MTRPVRVMIAAIGTLLVTAYAALIVAITEFLSPLAAAPGLTREEIASVAAERGEVIFSWYPYAIAGFGVALAIGILITAALVPAFHAWDVTASYLAMLALGVFAYFIAGFPAGMAVADGLGTSGGDHSGVGAILYSVSWAAFVLLVALGVIRVTMRVVATRRLATESRTPA
ncbi:hypothetical protein AB3M83_09340 [Microbacterium sp. 179-B 1A2 NHS]|uniref:hypothetical protein n=1 Tax=Microbacterium sp. 179-B 1A2 NHS TaxID=3142383 RepID=UPI0039A0EB60